MKKKYIYIPFDGEKAVFDKLSLACRSLKLNEGTIRNKFTKQRSHIWEGGKLEWIEVE